MIRFVYLLFFAAVSCNLDTNTSDPQASPSIEFSKENSLFIKKYKVISKNSYCMPNQAWLEYAWKNKLVFGKITREKLSGIQMVLKLTNSKKIENELGFYLVGWSLAKDDKVFGSGNGVFDVGIPNNKIENNVNVFLIKQPNHDGNDTLCKMTFSITQ